MMALGDDYNFLDVQERLSIHIRALGFLSDRIQDDQVMCNLMIIENGLKETEQMLSQLIQAGPDV